MFTRRTLLCGAFAAIQRGQVDAAIAKIQSTTASGDVSAAALYVEQGSTRIAKGFGKAFQKVVERRMSVGSLPEVK